MSEYQLFLGSIVSGKPVFLLITSPNCAPCENFKPMFGVVKEALGEFAHFHQIDMTDLPPGFLQTRGVRSAPTVLMYRFGLEEQRVAGDELKMFGLKASSFVDEFHTMNAGESTEYECEACQ